MGLDFARTSNDRVFELLDALESLGPGPHRLRDVAAQARLGPSTAHRILQAGIRAGTVTKAQRGRYALIRWRDQGAATQEPTVPVSLPLAVSRRIRLGLAALQESTGQSVLLYVPLVLDPPMRYCLAYFAPEHDELLSDAERLLATDMVFCAPLTVDAPGRLILAHMAAGGPAGNGRRGGADTGGRGRAGTGHTYGPSPVAGWNTLAVPLRRYGQIAGAICVTARAGWLDQHRDQTLDRLSRLTAELGDETPAYGDPNRPVLERR
ncbi:helix-turn-helix domain-containing protein [Polymorphospora sp. NPDC050346]|uniref:helix-turn-helix domain-containing protein n=1 Tax=Polymorphospora sp. NPDC050346 TaxID=3155780 RepID=UPI0033C08AF1